MADAQFNREEAARRAEAATSNVPGTCQMWTRSLFGAPSVGDLDKDRDADAVDGWLSESDNAKHFDDRNPPRGTPVAFSGGSRGYGHRAISLGNRKIRSTDMSATGYAAGRVGTTTIEQIEKAMGVRYLGWSETISGQSILLPKPPARPTPAKDTFTRGKNIDSAIQDLVGAQRVAKKRPLRLSRINRALAHLRSIKERKVKK